MSFKADSSLISGQLRIAALAIAAFDIIRTIPLEIRFYKSSSYARSFLLAAVRSVGIAALVANAALYFSSFTETTCHSVHLLPGILQLFAGLIVQCVIFYRTIDISQRCKTALSVMIFATIIVVPLESIAVGLNRQATLFANELTKVNGCLSLVREEVFNAGPVFYLAHLGFDLFAITLSSYHLMRTGDRATLLARLLGNGVAFMLVDAIVNFVTFLASIGIGGIENLGSICSIVAAILVAQHILFITRDAAPAQQEYQHEVLVLPNAVYKGSDPYKFNSTGSLPRFATPKRAVMDHSTSHTPDRSTSNTPYGGLHAMPTTPNGHRSMNSMDGSASMLHSCVGREALKYRVDGDVNMFQSKTSLCIPGAEDTKAPIALDVKRLSQQRDAKRLSQQQQRASVTGRSRPTTAESSDLDVEASA